MKFWIESTRESDKKVIHSLKGSVVIFLLTIGAILGAAVVLSSPNIFKYVFLDTCVL